VKAAPFVYHAPEDKAGVLKLMSELDDARVLAGGQSLMPMINLRIAAPSHLVDLNFAKDLSGIEIRDNKLVVHAMTRQREAEQSPLVQQHCPLLHEALHFVGFQQTRNRGTVGGSIAHLDPTAELVTVAFALEADIIVESVDGERRIPAVEFPAGYLASQIEPNEVLTRVEFPIWPDGHGAAFDEVTRRGESFALVSVGALAHRDSDGTITKASLAIGGLAPAPVFLDAVKILEGKRPDNAAIDVIADDAANLDADGDLNTPSEYKQRLAGVLTKRTLRRAIAAAEVSRHAG
jgi:aerobic carbon-monoxide dehydrogenase medium subunit